MLRQMRQRATESLLSARQVVLSACGPANIQAESLPCEAAGLALYMLVPRTSDLLFNLESEKDVVATAEAWQARGPARLPGIADGGGGEAVGGNPAVISSGSPGDLGGSAVAASAAARTGSGGGSGHGGAHRRTT